MNHDSPLKTLGPQAGAYQCTFEPVQAMRLKVEINTREHFSVLGITKHVYEVRSPWFSGSAPISTYHLKELLGTKLRALYHRRGGTDEPEQ